jgi:hypothetical protein
MSLAEAARYFVDAQTLAFQRAAGATRRRHGRIAISPMPPRDGSINPWRADYHGPRM